MHSYLSGRRYFDNRALCAALAVTCVLVSCGGGNDAPPDNAAPPDSGKHDVTSPPPNDAGENNDVIEASADATGDPASNDGNATGDARGADVTTGDSRSSDVGSESAADRSGGADVGVDDGGTVADAGGRPDAGSTADSGSPDAGDGSGPTGAGMWLKGDLHVHSRHSTDALDTTVAEAIAKAESLGFDYFVLTDHDNHVDGNITTWSDPDYRSDKLLLLYGTEWTTARGHANFFSTKPWDHAPLYAGRDGDGATSVALAHAKGLHFSVNHPVAKDLWEFGFELDFDSMEVWTAPFVFPNSNSNAILKWDELLLTGRRLAVRGGSDSHHQHDLESTLFNIGNPTTWIHSRAKTGEALLENLKAGHVSVSYAATAERVDFTGDVDGDGVYETIVGDNVRPADGKAIRFKIEIAGFRPTVTYNVTVFKNGTSFKNWQLTTASVTFEDQPAASERAYYRVEVRGPTSDAPLVSAIAFGDFIALSNAIYVSFP
jgi:hypothetical protein